jgi:hypothetical protein
MELAPGANQKVSIGESSLVGFGSFRGGGEVLFICLAISAKLVG